MSDNDFAQLIYLGLLLAAMAGWGIAEYRQNIGKTLRVALAWAMIIVALMAGYGLWGDLRRDVLPRQTVETSGEIVIPRAGDGHYYLRLSINGREVPFLVDTGASNMVLSPDDAQALGIDPATLAFIGEANTANGVVRTASVRLPLVELAGYRDEDFRAFVNEAPMAGSLLGMDYLRLYKIEIANDEMILRR